MLINVCQARLDIVARCKARRGHSGRELEASAPKAALATGALKRVLAILPMLSLWTGSARLICAEEDTLKHQNRG